MDRHVKWLRRRIVAAIATQAAETFAAAAVLAFALMYWRTDEGLLTVLFGAIVIGQFVVVARVGHAMRNNPLNYVLMRNYVDRPFSYRVSRFHGEVTSHPAAAQLPGFAPAATIRDDEAGPLPCFDVYHDPSRLVAASVRRASGAVSLISSLSDGRILVTDARALPPHERLVMTVAAEDTIESIISTHRRAVSARSDVVELAPSAHRVVLDALAIEHDAYAGLGAALSPFLDLEPSGRRFGLRMIARIRPEELVELPARLGTDAPFTTSGGESAGPERAAHVQPTPAHSPARAAAPEAAVPEVASPVVAAPAVASPVVAAPAAVEPAAATTGVVALEIPPPIVAARPVALRAGSIAQRKIGTRTVGAKDAPPPRTRPAVTVQLADIRPGAEVVVAEAAPVAAEPRVEPVVASATAAIAPFAPVDRFEDDPDVERVGEPITADVRVVDFLSSAATAMNAVSETGSSSHVSREAATAAEAPPRAAPAQPTAPVVAPASDSFAARAVPDSCAREPAAAPAGAPPAGDPSAFVHIPAALSGPAPVLNASGSPVATPSIPATLAAAMRAAPDTAESLVDSSIAFWEPGRSRTNPLVPVGWEATSRPRSGTTKNRWRRVRDSRQSCERTRLPVAAE